MPSANRGSIAYEIERVGRTIFKRCLECPKQMPVCPACSSTEECVLIPGSCNACAQMKCVAKQSTTTTSHGPNVGALAGGVLAGVAFVALAVYLIWRFWIKKRREQQDMELEEEWKNDEMAQQKRRTAMNGGVSDGASTRTRGSLANSILSRASNIIQIAYIPGVTNRGGSNTNSMYNIPVPPIPAAFRTGQQTPKSPLSNEGDALFFRPGDLRDSTWSDSSSIHPSRNNRDTQYTMHSITPSLARSSVASDIVYYDDATATPLPANAAQRAAPRMVSIKSAASTPSSESSSDRAPTPKAGGLQVMMPGTGSSGAGSLVRATQVTVGGKGKAKAKSGGAAGSNTLHVPAVPSPLAAGGCQATSAGSSDDEDEHSRARRSLLRTEVSSTMTSPSASNTNLFSSISSPSAQQQQPLGSPFFDPTDRPAPSQHRPNPYASMASSIRRSVDSPLRRGSKSIGGLSAVIEEASRRASKIPSSEELMEQRREEEREEGVPLRASLDSPFSDKHATE